MPSANPPFFREPARRLLETRQTLDRQADSLERLISLTVERRRHRLAGLLSPLSLAERSPAQAIRETRHTGALLHRRMEEIVAREPPPAAPARTRPGVLEALNPAATLARGYTITLDAAAGRPLISAENVAEGGTLRTRFHDGEVGDLRRETFDARAWSDKKEAT